MIINPIIPSNRNTFTRILLYSCATVILTQETSWSHGGGGEGIPAPILNTEIGEEIKENVDDADSAIEINDPLEPLNRGVYYINMVVDGLVMKPLAIAYRLLLPEPVRNSVGNFLTNLNAPVSFANHLLQWQPKRAGTTAFRFLVNSTLGVVGFLDVAEMMGYKKNETGFSETLGIWGVNTGPYLILPILGPSSFRGAAGLGGDYFLQPYNYYFFNASDDDQWISWAITGTNMVHQRNEVLEAVDEVEASSLDTYVTFRSLYFQLVEHRLKQLRAPDAPETTPAAPKAPEPVSEPKAPAPESVKVQQMNNTQK